MAPFKDHTTKQGDHNTRLYEEEMDAMFKSNMYLSSKITGKVGRIDKYKTMFFLVTLIIIDIVPSICKIYLMIILSFILNNVMTLFSPIKNDGS